MISMALSYLYLHISMFFSQTIIHIFDIPYNLPEAKRRIGKRREKNPK